MSYAIENEMPLLGSRIDADRGKLYGDLIASLSPAKMYDFYIML
jgi:hypothetical protein